MRIAGELVHVLLKELAEAEEHAGAAQRRLCGPCRKRRLRGGDGGVQFGAVRQRDQRLHLAGGRIVDLAGAAGVPATALPAIQCGIVRGAMAGAGATLGKTAVDIGEHLDSKALE